MQIQIRGATREECTEKIEYCEAYFKAHKRAWAGVSAKAFRQRVYRFHRWLSVAKIDLYELKATEVKAYWRYLAKHGITDNTGRQYRHSIRAFLKWAAGAGMIRLSAIELEIEKPIRPWLAEHAREIKQPHSNKILRIYAGEFYDWAQRQPISIEMITGKQLQDYECHLRNSVPARSAAVRRVNMYVVRRHLRWLCGRGLIQTSPAELGLTRRKMPSFFGDTPLPAQAKKFLRLMAAHKRLNTVRGYQTRLRHFHDHLRRRQLSLDQFTRLDFEEYLASMHRAGYAPQTRRHAIGAVQTYLSWLYECELLANDPEPIIRNFQRPRLPDYLPRNLQPEADRLVQERLEQRGDVVALALLLMRRTGIRIGDLLALTFDCLREDPDGNAYMKVPIGKLYNERFIPLDSTTLTILKRVRALSLANTGGQKPELLVIRRDGKPVVKNDYYLVLYEIDEALRLDANISFGEEPLVSHRLRHTYATTLLSAGLSIEAIKELLGHRSFSMSLRYAQVTPQKLRSDYLKAIAIAEGPVTLELAQSAPDLVMGNALDEVLAQLRGKLRAGHPDKKQLTALIRRIERVRLQLNKID